MRRNAGSTKNGSAVSRPFVSDAILIVVMTALSYGVGYAYEVGIADEFGIPVELIAVDPAMMLKAGGVLGGFLITLYFLLDYAAVFVPRSRHPWSFDIIFFIAWYVFWLVITYLSVGELKSYLFMTFLFLFIAASYALWPIFFGSKGLSYRERYIEIDAAEQKVMSRSITSVIVSKGGRKPALLVISCVLILYVSNQLGHRHAKTQEDYFIITTATNNAVLRMYGDMIVSTTFDPCTKRIVGPLLVQKLSDKSEVMLSQLIIGPLTVEHKKSFTANSDFEDGKP